MLKGLGRERVFNNEMEVHEYIEFQKSIYGNTFALKPMPTEMYEHVDPLDELYEMRSGR